MQGFFETKINFQRESEDKATNLIVMIDAMTFTESEAHATDFMTNEEGITDFEIKSMTRKFYTEVLITPDEDVQRYREIVIKLLLDGKIYSDTYLVSGAITEVALKTIKDHIKDQNGNPAIDSIKSKNVDEILIRSIEGGYKTMTEKLMDPHHDFIEMVKKGEATIVKGE